jgi:hypothetical protein
MLEDQVIDVEVRETGAGLGSWRTKTVTEWHK